MSKSHLKRINVPRTWDVKRKDNVFITRPKPAGHKLKFSLPLIVVFRDMLGKVKTTKELEFVLNNKEVYLNGKKAYSPKQAVGLMDVIRLPEIKEYYRIVINNAGVLGYVQIDEKESTKLPILLKNKAKLKSGKTQLNFTNGYCMLVDKDNYKTGDMLIYDFLQKKIIDHITLEKGAAVYFTSGKNIGETATLEEINDNSLICKKDDKTFEIDRRSAKDYLFLVGKEAPAIKLAD
ncbi:MAG: hypothetical protein ACOCZ6_00095 [Nanoarchaeota archaeon]